MKEYCTVSGFGRAEIEEKRSRFIGSCDFVSTEEEAVSFVNRIRSEFPDARHNVYAYLLREGSKTRYSDDKEPQGTAGMPVLEVIKKNQCLDAVIVVTRYFGGILLGAGGLARAYNDAAAAALKAAGRILRRPSLTFSFNCPYSDYDRCVRLLQQKGVTLLPPSFDATVTLSYTVSQTESGTVATALFDATGGKIVPQKTGEGWQNIII